LGQEYQVVGGLGWVEEMMGWVGLGYENWTHGHVCASLDCYSTGLDNNDELKSSEMSMVASSISCRKLLTKIRSEEELRAHFGALQFHGR